MPEDLTDEQADRMLQAALGGMTPHEALLAASRAEDEKKEERAAAIAKNRERALRLLAELDKQLDK
ncbi:MAG: hypothetical protein LWW81_04675 [Rhodocyclales bacterium]|nr:hypothetical protein [Rhodocyclales bacterium]